MGLAFTSIRVNASINFVPLGLLIPYLYTSSPSSGARLRGLIGWKWLVVGWGMRVLTGAGRLIAVVVAGFGC